MSEPEPRLEEESPPRYKILGEHGRGGIGRVMEAFDHDLDRRVALKELHRLTARSEVRFLREARLTARLEHPSIVPVHETGRWPDGTPYYAMKLVSGRSLKELIAETRTFDERLSLLPNVLAVAEAISYAHSRRIIHRDLKPGNVIVGEHGETTVIDWGLAKDLTEARDSRGSEDGPYRTSGHEGITVAGSVVGTPAYMPPEQARGEHVDERADVYALGAILYHTLAGTPPYDRGTSEEVLANVLTQPPPALQRREPAVPHDLAALVSKAIDRDPARRYESAAAFVEDLRSFMSGRLISAHSYSPTAMLRKWVARHRSLATVVVAAVAILSVVTVIAVMQIASERDTANHERQRAERERNSVILTHATKALATDPTEAVAWAKQLPDEVEHDPARRMIASDAASRGVTRHLHPLSKVGIAHLYASADARTLVAADSRGTLFVVDAPSGRIIGQTSIDPSGQIAITRDGRTVVAPARDGGVLVWQRDAGEFRVEAHDDLGLALALSFDGETAVTGGLNGEVYGVEIEAKASTRLYRHADSVLAIGISPDQRLLASGSADGSLTLYDLEARRVIRELALSSTEEPPVNYLAFVGDFLVTAHGDGTLALWSHAGELVRRAKLSDSAIDHFRVAADERYLVAFTRDQQIMRVELSDFATETLAGRGSTITNSLLTRDGDRELLVVTYFDGGVRLVDMASRATRTLLGHRRTATGAQTITGPAGDTLLATTSLDGDLRYWPIPRQLAQPLHQHQNGVLTIEVAGTGGAWASCGRDGLVFVETEDGRRSVLSGHTDLVYELIFSRDARYLASGGWDRVLIVWDLQTMQPVATREIPASPGSMAFDDDGGLLVAINDTIYRWTLASDDFVPIHTFDEPISWFLPYAKAGGTTIMLVTESGTVFRRPPGSDFARVSERAVGTFEGEYVLESLPRDGLPPQLALRDVGNGKILGSAIAPFDASWARFDQQAQIVYLFDAGYRGAAWSLSDGTVTTLRSPNGPPKAVQLFPDGAVARMVEDGAFERWDFDRREILTLRQHESSISMLGIAKSMGVAITGSSDGRVWRWNLAAMDREWKRHRNYKLTEITDQSATHDEIN